MQLPNEAFMNSSGQQRCKPFLLRTLLKFLPLLLLLLGSAASAQNYTYTTEGFEQSGIWPTSNSSTEVSVAATTGTWKVQNASRNTSTFAPGGAASLSTSSSGYFITPFLPSGAAVLTWKSSSSSTSGRPYVVSTSVDGATFTSVATGTGYGNASGTAWGIITVNINNAAIRYVKVQTNGGGTAYYDDVNLTTAIITAPSVTTATATSITFNSANSGGNITSDGGAMVAARGVVWSTTPSPTLANNSTSNGTGTGAFTSNLSSLTPSTTYYYRAYATNSAGTSYGQEFSFTTAAPTPTLYVSPSSLAFGNQTINTFSVQQTYTLSGLYLSPAAGNITITAPAGYTVSAATGGGFASSITVPYTGSTLNTTTIYVRFAPSAVGVANGNILNSGGGAPTVNVALTGVGAVPLPDVTNVGLDFWTGFGYQEKMSQRAGNSGEAKLSLYLSVPAGSLPATVMVELPGIPGAPGFPQIVTINPGTVTEIQGFPTGDPANANNPTGLPDTRLYYTGVSNRGIHIYSTNGVPVSAWIYSYTTGNSAAGAMLFPTNTWASSYTVQAYGGYSNNSNPNSFFFVIAKEDNTAIYFKPSQDVLDSITGSSGTIFTDGHTAAQVKYAKGVEYGPIILNKGQVFNAMGFITGSGSGITPGKAFGLDLSGSTVRTTCDKSIAVFGGNGRCLINAGSCGATSGSDHMIQQMFPDVAFGKKFLTVPTKTMEYNLYRINVTDPTTQVWVNNPSHTTPLTGIINNQYYELTSSLAQLIESDKPISVTQFIVAEGCANQNGSKGLGDPEMIILSPVEQAINTTTVYSATIKNPAATYNGHYINVVLKTNAVASFRLDGGTTGDPGIDQTTATSTTVYNTGGTLPITSIFKPHPQDASYSYATFKVAPGASHTLSSDSSFTAIAYGMGDGESYGYNAGTKVKDLSQVLLVRNTYGQTTALTCKNNPFYFRIALPYAPAQLSSLTWDFFNNPALLPNSNVTQNTPTPDSSYAFNGTTYYVYSLPSSYQFSSAGVHPFKVSANALSSAGCTGTKVLNNSINVVDGPKANFTPQIGNCGNLTVNFTDASTSDSTIVNRWNWDFGNTATLADTSHLQNPSYMYPSAASYTVQLRAINAAGCYKDTSRIIDLTGALTVGYTTSPSTTICAGSSITFTSTSTSSGTSGIINQWIWNFGDGSPVVTATTNAQQLHSYTTAGTYTATLQVKTTTGCTSTVYSVTIIVNPVPAITSAATGTICSGAAQNYSITSNVSGATFSWSRAAVTGISNAAVSNQTSNSITETLVNATASPINVTYTITASSGGCSSTTFNYVVTVNSTPVVNSASTGMVCSGNALNYQILSNVTGATFTWSRAAVTGISNTALSGQTSTPITETLTNATGAAINVTYVITPSSNGCSGPSFNYTVTVNPKATITSAASATVCNNTALNYTITSNVSGSTFNWSRGAVAGISNAAVSNQTSSTITETLVNTTAAPIAVTYVTTAAANSCPGTAFNYAVTVNPTATVSSAATGQACSGVAQNYTITSGVSGATFTWNRAAVTGISNAAATGSGSAITETLTNTTSLAVNVTYVITPSANGCAGTPFSYVVTVNPKPTTDFTFTNSGCSKDAVNFTATASSNVTGYSWNFGDGGSVSTVQNPVKTYSTAGTYSVTLTVSTGSGCTTTVTKPVTLAATLAAPVIKVDSTINSVTFSWPAVSGATGYQVSVDNGATFIAPNGANGLSHIVSGLQANQSVTIIVRAAATLTCQNSQATATGKTFLPNVGIYVPNTFTPNGDGKNDVLKVYGNYIQSLNLQIFTQWGQKIYSTTDANGGWNGTASGKAQPVGVYAYVVTVTLRTGEVITKKGLFNLIR